MKIKIPSFQSSPDRYSPVLNMSGQSISNVLPQLKKRRKRTNLDTKQKDSLDTYFLENSRPDHGRMAEIGNELDLDPDVSELILPRGD